MCCFMFLQQLYRENGPRDMHNKEEELPAPQHMVPAIADRCYLLLPRLQFTRHPDRGVREKEIIASGINYTTKLYSVL